MNIIDNIFEYETEVPASVVTIGKFDGLHRGHQALLEQSQAIANAMKKEYSDLQTMVFTFDVSPVTLLTKKERRQMLEQNGFDTIIECEFGPKIITMPAETFIEEILVKKLHVKHVVVGADFHFGYERRGDTELLKSMGEKLGFTADAVPIIMNGREKVSSTAVRKALMRGNMEKVNQLLGYSYTVSGEIIHGNQLGRTIGVPTANIIPDSHKLLPPNGVYSARTMVNDKVYYGITNVGTKPTVDGSFVGVETYLFDFDGDIYGESMSVELLHFQRPEVKFDTIDALKARIHKDEEEGRAFFDKLGEV